MCAAAAAEEEAQGVFTAYARVTLEPDALEQQQQHPRTLAAAHMAIQQQPDFGCAIRLRNRASAAACCCCCCYLPYMWAGAHNDALSKSCGWRTCTCRWCGSCVRSIQRGASALVVVMLS